MNDLRIYAETASNDGWFPDTEIVISRQNISYSAHQKVWKYRPGGAAIEWCFQTLWYAL